MNIISSEDLQVKKDMDNHWNEGKDGWQSN